MDRPPETLPSAEPKGQGVRALVGVLVILFVLRVLVALVQVPPFIAPALSLVLSAIFVAVPIIGLFYAANHRWSPLWSGAMIILGIALQAGLNPLSKTVGIMGPIFGSLAQTGLVLWCFGLGAMVASLIKDKNLLLPVAIFLAGFDVFLVTYPLGPVQQVFATRPEVFQNLAYAIPRASEAGQAVALNIGAYVGPADFIFLSMFFVALYKFRMRTRETLPWMIGALVAYLLVVLLLGDISLGPISLGALPALLPIGLVVLLVNLREFQLKKDEWAGTVVVGLLALGLAAFGIYSASRKPQAPPPETLPPVVVPAPEGSVATPVPTP